MAGKPKLSKNVFQMKFMKKCREKFEKEELEVEQKAIFVHDITDDMRKACKFLTESSYISCENLRFGRMSFHGFNSEVEKFQKKSKPSKVHVKKPVENEGISNEEFAERYANLVGTMKKKFAKKRQRPAIQEENDTKKQKTDDNDEEVEVKKSKISIQITEEGKDALKARYPRRKRAAEFWKPDGE